MDEPLESPDDSPEPLGSPEPLDPPSLDVPLWSDVWEDSEVPLELLKSLPPG